MVVEEEMLALDPSHRLLIFVRQMDFDSGNKKHEDEHDHTKSDTQSLMKIRLKVWPFKYRLIYRQSGRIYTEKL